MNKANWKARVLALCAVGIPMVALGAESTKPNIVFILADDMGYGDLNCQNPESKIPTPNLDELAAQGMRFTDAHSPSSVCTPTRYSILTGRYCWRSRLKKGVLWEWDEPLIEPGRLTVPAMLKEAGYNTACIGKWHLGWNWPKSGSKVDFSKPIGGGPLTVGFDTYFGDDVPNFPPYCFIEDDRTLGIPTEQKPAKMFGRPGPMLKGWKLENVMPAITDKAVGYVRKQSRDNSFFLYFALTAPHTPIAPTEEFIGKSEAGPYGDFVFEIDHCIGRVMKALEEKGLADNTLVIFTSDNGSPCRNGENMSGPVGSVRKTGHDPSRPWRGLKGDSWEGGHRVPFLVRWPGTVPAGQVNDELICHVDFMRTVAETLGKDLPKESAEDSYNILPAFKGEKLDNPIREAVIHHSFLGMFCVRQGKWKLILGTGSGGFSHPRGRIGRGGQLYDLESDPGEKNNLYSKHPEIVKTLTELLTKYKKDGRSVDLTSDGVATGH